MGRASNMGPFLGTLTHGPIMNAYKDVGLIQNDVAKRMMASREKRVGVGPLAYLNKRAPIS